MTEQKSRLVVEISSEQAKRNAELLNQELDKLYEKGNKSSTSSAALGKELKTTGESAKSLGESTSKTTKDLAQQESQLNKNGSAVMQLAKYVAGYLTISKAISMADGYTQTAARIRNATTSTQEYNLVQDRLLSTANTTFRALSEAQEVYLSMSGGMKSLGYSTAQTLDMTDSLSFAFTANATRADQAQSAMDALSKSMAKGKVDADAWISIVTGADNVIADMAKTTGRSESEIRQLGATGKISLTELIKTLIQTKDANEALANNMENSFADGMQKLSNAVTEYLGKANESTSATGMLAAALGTLADNLDTVSNVAMLGGVAYLTKVIATQTLAVRASILASINKRNATIAELESQVRLSAVEVQRTRQVTALAATEVNLARAEYNSATTRNERAAATIRLTQAEIAHNLAMKQTTIATTAQTAAQNALNTSQAIGSRLFNLVGGGVGVLTIGVAALAAGYMYMQSRIAQANKKLEEQASVAKKAKEELLALKGIEKDNAIEDMTVSFKRQNEALAESSTQINIQLTAIKRLYAGNKEVVQVVEDAQNGTISMTEALKKFNELRISKDIYNALKENIPQFIKFANEAKNSKEKLSLFGKEAVLAGRDAQIGAVGVDVGSKSMTEHEKATKAATQAQKDFRASLYDQEFDAVFTRQLLAKNATEEQIKVILEAAKWARKNNVKFTNELAQEALRVHAIEQKNKNVIEGRNKAERDRTKELKEQVSISKRLIGISGNSGIGTGAHLDVRYGGSRDGQKVSKEHLARLQAGGKSLPSYRVSSDYGQRKAPTKGASSFHKGIDFAMPVGTPITTNVAVKDVKTAYDSKGGGYYSTVTFEDGVVLKLLHQAPSMMSKVKGGASEGTLKANQDLEKQAEDAARNQLQLTLAVATEKTRIETQLAEDIKDIRKAEFSTEEEEKLIAQYKERAANDIAIAEYALKTKLDDYADFQKSEAELLEKSFAQKKFAASRDLELTKGERSKAVDLLNQQLLQEQSYLALATEQRLFQIKQAYMHEVDIMQERYRLERLEIAKTKDPEQRSKLLNASYRAEDNDYETKRRNAHNEYRSMKAQQDGSGEFLQLDFAKEDAQKTIEESIKYNLITEEQAKRDLLQIEEDYQKAKLQLQLNYGERIAGSVTDSMATIFGEQSTAYKAMFAVQKGFAIAQSMLAIQQGIANAMSLPFPKNLGAAAIVAAETASILSNIKAVTMTVSGRKEGYFNGGFTGVGGKFDPAGIVHRGEVVWSQDDIKRWGGVSVVEAMRTSKPSGYSDGGFVSTKDTRRVGFGVADAVSRSGDESFALKVIINNAPEGTTAERGVDGNLYVTIPQVKQMIKESWGSLGRTGSFESKQVSQNFDTRKRLG